MSVAYALNEHIMVQRSLIVFEVNAVTKASQSLVHGLAESASHNRLHISPWCFAAEQNLGRAARRLLCINYLFSRNTALQLLAIFTLDRQLLATSVELRLDQIA